MSANSPVVKRFLVTMTVLAVGLIVGILVITPPPVESQSAASLAETEVSLLRGIDASAARWNALGAHYAPDYEAIAAVNSARWNALGAYFTESKARVADAARWNALGAHYAPDYQAIAAVNSARWNALGEWYAAKTVQGQ